MCVAPVIGRHCTGIDAEVLDGIDHGQAGAHARPAAEMEEQFAARRDAGKRRTGLAGRDRAHDIEPRQDGAIVVRGPAHEREDAARGEGQDAPAAIDHLVAKRRAEAEKRTTALLELFQIDLIVLAGFMRILGEEFAARYPQRIINLHPALLTDPGEDHYTSNDGVAIPALRGLNVVEQAIELGLPVTGSTVHYVVPAVDAGPVISRAEVPIESGDTPDILHEKLKVQEHRLIVDAVRDYTTAHRLPPRVHNRA